MSDGSLARRIEEVDGGASTAAAILDAAQYVASVLAQAQRESASAAMLHTDALGMESKRTTSAGIYLTIALSLVATYFARGSSALVSSAALLQMWLPIAGVLGGFIACYAERYYISRIQAQARSGIEYERRFEITTPVFEQCLLRFTFWTVTPTRMLVTLVDIAWVAIVLNTVLK